MPPADIPPDQSPRRRSRTASSIDPTTNPARGREDRYGRPAKPLTKRLANVKPSKLRIIGGQMRGRGVTYLGDRNTRPMKESLREALFNIVGPAIKDRIAWDLFSGTGILAIESYSRGAKRALAIERGRTFARTIRDSAAAIGLSSAEVEVIQGDTFRVSPVRMGEVAAADPLTPWVVYFCPPYAMWAEQTEKLFGLLQITAELAPANSLLVTESDKFFDVATLPLSPWDVRPKGNMTLAFHQTDRLGRLLTLQPDSGL